jgi:hypothetical protein
LKRQVAQFGSNVLAKQNKTKQNKKTFGLDTLKLDLENENMRETKRLVNTCSKLQMKYFPLLYLKFLI